MIKFSIIIPHYNSVESLEKLLESIDFHEDVEVIVIDDKSNKNVDEYLQSQRKYKNVALFLDNDTDQKGAGVCRNIGVRQSTGKWLLFADADDLFLPGWYDAVQSYYESKADVIFFSPTSKVDNKNGKRHVKYARLVDDYIDKRKDSEVRLRLQFFPPWSKLIRKVFLTSKEIEFDETLYSNDVMFSTKIGFYASSVVATNCEIYCVIDKAGTLTKNKSFDAFYIRNEVLCRVYDFLRDQLTTKQFRESYIRNAPIVNIYNALKNRYGIWNIGRLFSLYRSHNIPIITSGAFNLKKVKGFLQQ